MLGALLVSVGALGCAAGPAPTDHFYRLEAGAPERRFELPLLPGTLEIRRFRSDAVLEERRVLVRRDGRSHEIEPVPYHYWTDSPTRAVQIELARYLRSAGVAEGVVMPEARVRADHVLSGRLLRLEQVLGGKAPTVDLQLELSLTREADRTLVLVETYREQTAASSGKVTDAARALGSALTRIFDRFLEDASPQ